MKANPNLTVVIACKSDPDIANTIQSIRDTGGDDVPIIVVDDFSDPPLVGLDARVVRNPSKEHSGCGPARHLGIELAQTDWVLITDSHMRFPQGWLDVCCERMVPQRAASIQCGVCVPFTATSDLDYYAGATYNLCGPDSQKPGEVQLLECVWLPRNQEPDDDAEIPAVMGACYLAGTRWLRHLRPLKHLRSWGCDELMLSLKSWLGGGDCRLIKPLRVQHRFYEQGERQPFRIPEGHGIFNKLFAAHTLFDHSLGDYLCRKIAFHNWGREFAIAEAMIKENWPTVLAEQTENRHSFVRKLDWLAAKFGFSVPKVT